MARNLLMKLIDGSFWRSRPKSSVRSRDYHERLRALLQSRTAPADRIRSLYDSALQAAERGDCAAAIKIAKECSNLAFDQFGDSDPIPCLLQLFYGDILARCGESKEAARQLSELTNALIFALVSDPKKGHPAAAELFATLVDTALSDSKLTDALQASDSDGRNLVLISNLSVTLLNNDAMQSSVLAQGIYDFRAKTKGEDHEDTLLAAHKLSSCLIASGRYQDARPLLEKTFQTRVKLYGFEHPLSLRSASGLAVALFSMGERQKAVSLQEQVYRASLKINGKEHDQTRVALNNLNEMRTQKPASSSR
jgi:tetratricopeptide (TPR) repeat protein